MLKVALSLIRVSLEEVSGYLRQVESSMLKPSSLQSSEHNRISQSYPLVSIIIPYYMHEEFIAETVWSAKRQTYPNVEIIVVDDGSPAPPDRALDNITGIKLVRTENLGCPGARNIGFNASSGKYLIFLDGDDVLLPGAIEAHLEALAASPAACLSFGSVRIIDREGNEKRAARICAPRKNYFLMLLEHNPIASPGSMMLRRDPFVEVGLYDSKLRYLPDDYELLLRLAKRYDFVQHSTCVLEYRRHSTNVSRDQEAILRGTLAVLDSLEKREEMTPDLRRRIQHGRKRWIHQCRPKDKFSYHLRSIYYRGRELWNIPFRHLFNAD
jgi:glycosyltransferase involved in cell wall biosynthesis